MFTSGTRRAPTSRSRRSSTQFGLQPGQIKEISGARPLGIFGDCVTTDHISPAGSIKKTSPAGKYLLEHGVTYEDFNSYGSRRGNDRVMTRGTFANVRIKNLMVPGVEGGVTKYQPAGEQMSIYDAAMKYAEHKHAAHHLRRPGIRHRQLARLGGQRHRAPRRQSRRRAKLRAHPSLQPRRHGRASAAIQGRHHRADAETRRHRDLRPPRPRRESKPQQDLTLRIKRANGQIENVPVRCRIDTPIEIDYYQHGGILPFVLRQLVAKA